MGFWKYAGGAALVVLVPGPTIAYAAGLLVTDRVFKKIAENREGLDLRKEEEINKRLKSAKQKENEARKLLEKLTKEKNQTEARRKAEDAARKAEEEMRIAEQARKDNEELLSARFNGFVSNTVDPRSTLLMCCKLKIAMANADGEISDEEMKDMKEFQSGMEGSAEAKAFFDEVGVVLRNPPSLDDVLNELEGMVGYEKNVQDYFDLLVSTMLADDVIHHGELDFIERFLKKIDAVKCSQTLPYRCLRLPRSFSGDTAVIALCLEPNGGRCEIWINNEYRLSDRPLVNLSSENFTTLFDSDALEALDDVGECRIADHVKFVFCGEDQLFAHAEKVIKGEGDRYSISRCPCCDGAV